MIDNLRLAEMLCTRLCHDLTGPIGAVNNGAEFLSEEGFNLQNQAVELITSSAFSAVARLQFYRLAYGRVKDHGEASLADGQRLASDFFADGKVALDWPDQYTDASGVPLSMRMMRLLFNLLMISTASLLRGGKVAIKIEQLEDGSKVLEVTATGDSIKWDKETESALIVPMDVNEVSPKNVQLYLTQRLADELQAKITLTHIDNSLCIRAVQKITIDETSS
jgi:histidine phosphotransferase ChpT